MAVSNVTKVSNGRKQFAGLFDTVIEYEATWDPDSVAPNGFFQEDVTVPGVRLGDIVLVSFVADLLNLSFEGHVKSADTISLHLSNNTAGAVDLTASDVHIIVLRPYHSHS